MQLDENSFTAGADVGSVAEDIQQAPESTQFFGDQGPLTFKPEADVPLTESPLTKFANTIGVGGDKGASPLTAFTQLLGLGAQSFGIANQIGAQKQLSQQNKVIQQGQKQAITAAEPAVKFGTETLNAAAQGKLPAPLQQIIENWKQQAKADMASRFASMGEGNSEQLQDAFNLIDKRALEMEGTILQQQEETGLAGIQTGVSAATGVTGSAQNQQKMLTDLIASANQQLATIAGRG